jgi:hypothetical protein
MENPSREKTNRHYFTFFASTASTLRSVVNNICLCLSNERNLTSYKDEF